MIQKSGLPWEHQQGEGSLFKNFLRFINLEYTVYTMEPCYIHLVTPSYIVKNIDKGSTINSLSRGGVSEVGKNPYLLYFF